MNPEQAKQLGAYLREARQAAGMSGPALAAAAGIDQATVVRLEQGAFANPTPEKLAAIGKALDLPLADIFTLADYPMPTELPSFTPYLRSKYRDLPDSAVADMERYFEKLAKKHGFDPNGPAPGQDEM